MGYHASPLGFPPYKHFGKGRFDGPPALFRTLYCAEDPLTSLREILVQFRPPAKARRDFARLGLMNWPPVPLAWRRDNVLVSAEIEISSGSLLSLTDQVLLTDLEVELADLLESRGIAYLTLGEIQGADRHLTQAIARALYDRDAAGVLFPSKYEGGLCAGLFEGRARLREREAPQSLAAPQAEFDQVCREYGLLLEPGAT